MKLLVLSAILMVVPSSILGENIFLDNLKPEEAQKYIAANDLQLKYAPKLGEGPISLTRAGNGESWYRGRKLSNPGDYVEETYLANQFHGQDGLGRALFGYSDWNQGRVEAINGNGHVRGSYKYVDPYGKDFIANYWSDGLGFHQEDNRPKVPLEPVTDTPAVQHARQEHFRKYNEIVAEHAKAGPDPYSDYYNRESNRYDEDQDKIDQVSELIGSTSNQHQALTRYPDLSQKKPVIPDRDYNPATSHDSVTVDRYDGRKLNRNYEPEPTGPPHGFYYNFDYPVYLLRNVKEGRQYGGQFDYNQNLNGNSGGSDQYGGSARYDAGAFNGQQQYSTGKQQYSTGQQQFSTGQQQFSTGQPQFGVTQQYSTGGPFNTNPYNNNNGQYETKYHHKRTVETELASPAVKTVDQTAEARVDAVHDAQVSPKQRDAATKLVETH